MVTTPVLHTKRPPSALIAPQLRIATPLRAPLRKARNVAPSDLTASLCSRTPTARSSSITLFGGPGLLLIHAGLSTASPIATCNFARRHSPLQNFSCRILTIANYVVRSTTATAPQISSQQKRTSGGPLKGKFRWVVYIPSLRPATTCAIATNRDTPKLSPSSNTLHPLHAASPHVYHASAQDPPFFDTSPRLEHPRPSQGGALAHRVSFCARSGISSPASAQTALTAISRPPHARLVIHTYIRAPHHPPSPNFHSRSHAIQLCLDRFR
jgi:hypothetical protein